MKKYCFLINSLRVGGAERVCVELVNQFYREGHTVDLIVLHTKDAPLVSRLDRGINIIDLNVAHARKAFSPLRKAMEKGQYNSCLVFNPQLTVVLVLMRWFYRRLDFVVVARNINTLSEKLKREKSIRHKYLNGVLIKSLYRKADVFIAQSTGMKDDMVNTLGIPETKITTIFNPKMRELGKIEDGERSNADRKKEILFVGSLKPQKNVSFLLDSVKRLSSIRTDFVLRIVGDGELRLELEEKMENLRLEDYVHFEGRSMNVSEFYTKADVMVLTSWYEGFPNVLVEALSYSVPVVSVNCKSGPDDILEDGVNGFLVEEYDSETFALKLDEALNRCWDKDSIQQTIEKFSFDAIYSQYKNVLTGEIA